MASHHLANFGGHTHCGSGDIMVLFCHVILPDHMNKGSSNMVSLPSLVPIGTVVVEIKWF